MSVDNINSDGDEAGHGEHGGWPIDGGETGALIRAFDWSRAGLGCPSTWPQSLKTAVDILLASPVPIVMLWGGDGVMIYNDPYSVFAGGRHPQLLGSKVLEGWPEVADFNRRVMEVGLAGGTLSFRDQQLVLYRHGVPEDVWMNLDYSPIRDESGRPAGVLAIVVETSERIRAENAMRASEAEFRTLAEALPHHAWAARPDGELVWFNARVYDYTGFPPGTLDGQKWQQVVHPHDLAATLAAWAHSVATGDVYEVEFRLLHGQRGEYRWFLARAVPMRDGDGNILRWIGTNTDIHDRKVATAELQRLNTMLEERVAERTRERDRVWNVSQDLLAVCDSQGVLRSVNPAWTRVLGWSVAELVGHSTAWLEHPDEGALNRSELGRLLATGRTLRFENRLRHKDGSYRWLSWNASTDGGLLYSSARDITEDRKVSESLHQAEEALRQSQKMEALGQLTGGIAHDFNNLLQGIIGSLGIARRRLPTEDGERIGRFVDGAINSANRAAALTHRLLAFSRRQPLDPRPVDVNHLLVSMEDMLRRTMGEGIRIELGSASALWPTRCDPNQLESAVLNLAINARDAMPDGGTLHIASANVVIDPGRAAAAEMVPGEYVCLTVRDSGIGMSPEVKARAFDPFFTTKPLGQGTGLGLSMIYGFARQSEGHVRIDSEIGHGTTVSIHLPRFRGDMDGEAAPGAVAQPAGASGETVLVVEDEAVVRGLIVEILQENGYGVLQAPDGPAALQILQSSRHIDLLVTDIGLPGLNGRQLADAAQSLRPGLRVLLMTGYAAPAAAAEGFLQRGMELITKPFPMEALSARIREMLAGR